MSPFARFKAIQAPPSQSTSWIAWDIPPINWELLLSKIWSVSLSSARRRITALIALSLVLTILFVSYISSAAVLTGTYDSYKKEKYFGQISLTGVVEHLPAFMRDYFGFFRFYLFAHNGLELQSNGTSILTFLNTNVLGNYTGQIVTNEDRLIYPEPLDLSILSTLVVEKSFVLVSPYPADAEPIPKPTMESFSFRLKPTDGTVAGIFLLSFATAFAFFTGLISLVKFVLFGDEKLHQHFKTRSD